MTRLAKTFNRLREQQRKALVIYLTAGDPDLHTSVAAALAAVEAGADVLEIGVPFSDPVADGPVIQRAMVRALAGGGGFEQALQVVRQVRAETDVPIVLFGYLNPLLWYGLETSCRRVAEAGADGVLVVDVPEEESGPIRQQATASGLEWVALIAPTSGPERAQRIAADATGFLYVVSMTGVTGGALTDLSPVEPVVAAVRAKTQIPLCLGFGVRDRDSARAAASLADGVVVGSAVVAELEAALDSEDPAVTGPERVAARVREVRIGIDQASAHGQVDR